jgi:alcohol dehydrogenase, propanol-preferring
MRAMVLTQQKRVEELPLTQREMDAPRAGPGEVRVKVSVCAVCRTDLHIIEGDLEPSLTECRSSPAIRLLDEWTKPATV